MNARGASLQGGKLTLTGVSANSILFADRPVRAGRTRTYRKSAGAMVANQREHRQLHERSSERHRLGVQQGRLSHS